MVVTAIFFSPDGRRIRGYYRFFIYGFLFGFGWIGLASSEQSAAE